MYIDTFHFPMHVNEINTSLELNTELELEGG